MAHVSWEKGVFEIDFSKGFTWYSIIKVTPQQRPGQKVIYEIKQESSYLKLTIGLDNNDDICAWFKDVDGNEFTFEPVKKPIFYEKFVFFCCSIIPRNNNIDLQFSVMDIDSYDENTTEKTISANLGCKGKHSQILGANLDQRRNAAFQMSQLLIYNAAHSKKDRIETLKLIERDLRSDK